jgi:membrane-associated phospholipid phosphatase
MPDRNSLVTWTPGNRKQFRGAGIMRFVLIITLLINVYVGSPAQNADIRLLRHINSPDPLPSDNFFRFISDSDPYLCAMIPAGITAAGYFGKNDRTFRNGLTGVAAIAITGGVTTIMKYAINRDRPFITYTDIVKKAKAGTPSFPSGHTSEAFATATYLSLSYPKWYVIAPSFAWAGTVGYSRMHLGVHYPSDVLVGAIIGSGCAWLTYRVSQKLAPPSR